MSDEDQEPTDEGSRAQRRIRALVAEKKELAAQLEQLQSSASKYESQIEKASKQAQEAQEARAALELQLQEREGRWTATRALYEAGITDPELQDVVLYRYGKLDGEGRPELGEWLAADDGAKSDKALSVLLAPPPEPQKTQRRVDTEATAKPPPRPRGNDREDYLQLVEQLNRTPQSSPKYAELLERSAAHPWVSDH